MTWCTNPGASSREFGILLIRIVLLVLFAGSSFVTTAFALDQKIADAIDKTGLHIKGQPRNSAVRLPKSLVGQQWSLTNHVCKKAGYDLTPYAGQIVNFAHFDLKEEYSWDFKLIVVTKDSRCICIYVVAPGVIPGIMAVSDLTH